ncbi:MAG: AtpZ/AtpI family protein [Anaerolineales bacterium]|nr:AtpZ/AtpI family protein [Anaerolineales bacterium]
MAQSDREQNRRNMVNTLLIVVVGQVGCLTLAVILASVFGGLWLDNMFGTKPMFTLVLLFAGIPLSVILMLYVSRRALARLKEKYETGEKENTA